MSESGSASESGFRSEAGERPRHLPTVDDTTRPFWEAARAGRLMACRCGRCTETFLYPRPFCPSCWSDAVSWIELSGRGTLYTYSIVHRTDLPPFAGRVPYVAALVDLDEGPRLMTNVVDCAPDELRVGMPLEVTFRAESEEIHLPLFRPAT